MPDQPGSNPAGAIKSAFPYFGGKSRAASLIWSRFGNVGNYVEPFAGSLAVLLARPHPAKTETVNDADCFIANFFRALQAEPERVAEYADLPVNECDLEARHRWLMSRDEFRERMKHDPDYYDCKIAGWWVWGKCAWIGTGWCLGISSWGKPFADGELSHPRLPELGRQGTGLLSSKISCQIPSLGRNGEGIHSLSCSNGVEQYLKQLSERLRRVRVVCGDWSRIMGETVTTRHGMTGILLDPPYTTEERCGNLYGVDTGTVAADVLAWCKTNGGNPLLRIALCSYGEHEPLPGWERINWKANGGYGNQGNGRGKANARRETIDFSPACLKESQKGLDL